jgi:tetrapyrrole methylase family protein / MazG family protein
MEEFTELVRLMETLRGDQGCPWDRKQTEGAFKTFLLEEVYELIDAIEKEDDGAILEELGDLLFHIVFIAQICKEKGQFGIADVIRKVCDKMYGRHPHVFGSPDPSETSIEKRWDEIKREEKPGYSPVANVPRTLPALLRAFSVSKRAAKTGFDWEKLEDIYDKMNEEIKELRVAESSGSKDHIREEIGDLLFTVANISRFHEVDPEDALRGTIAKFLRRFGYIESKIDLEQADLKTMDALWDEAKSKEKKRE